MALGFWVEGALGLGFGSMANLSDKRCLEFRLPLNKPQHHIPNPES